MNLFFHAKAQRGGAATKVAQNCILPYRGFAIRWPWPTPKRSRLAAPCRMQFGDTADYKSALRVRRSKNLCRNARSWDIALQRRKGFSSLRPGVLA